MITLGIETSCDETAVALIEDGKVLSSEVSSSVHLHADYGGVVPEIASRFHTEYIFSVFKKALEDASVSLDDVDLVAVTNGPGLPGSLLVGVAFAKAISYAKNVPIIGVNHLKAHIYSCFLGKGIAFAGATPFLGAVVSGGHTSIYVCRSVKDLSVIGRTKDDAAGEAFDKVAKILGMGYPGGPIVEERARNFNGNNSIDFPRALLRDKDDLDFSFSGIKTAVMYHWKSADGTDQEKDRVCFSFQEAVVDVIEEKLLRAVKTQKAKILAVGGGVINNRFLRERLQARCKKEGIELYLPDKEFCTDNAAMIAVCGEALYNEGERSDLLLNADPGLY